MNDRPDQAQTAIHDAAQAALVHIERAAILAAQLAEVSWQLEQAQAELAALREQK